MPPTYDIAIVGAGPAGATLARLAARAGKIVLIDKRDLSGEPPADGPDKCCGGLLAPDAQKALGRLGMGLPRGVLVEPQLFLVRAIDAGGRIERHYQRHYINIDRGRFDRWLVSLVPAAVERRFGRRFRSMRAEPDGVTIELSCDGRSETIRARLLVGADGAASRVRTQLAPGRRPRTYVAVQEWFEANGATPYYSAVFDPAVTDYYSWTIPKEGRLIVGSALAPARDARERFERLKQRLRSAGFRLGRPVLREAAMLVRPARDGDVFLGGGRVLLAGEAAGLVSPSSGEGISYALASAECLAEALQAGPAGAGECYGDLAGGLRRSIAAKCLKSRILYDGRLRGLLMALGLRSIRPGHASRSPLLREVLGPQAGQVI